MFSGVDVDPRDRDRSARLARSAWSDVRPTPEDGKPAAVRLGIERVRRLRAAAFARFVPRRNWYRAALIISRVESKLEPVIGYRVSASGTAARLQSWIKDLTGRGPFPIPMRLCGIELLESARSRGRGVVLCSVHVPLYDLFLPALIDAGHTPDLIVVDDESVTGGGIAIAAGSGTAPAAAAGPKVLLSVRSVLRKGGTVISMLDRNVDAPLSDSVFRLAGKLSSPVLFFFVELGADGSVGARLQAPPYQLCDSEEAIRSNLAVAEAYRTSWKSSLARAPR